MRSLLSRLRRPLLAALLLGPTVALACPVCGQAQNAEVEKTYIAMTIFMSLTPLALIIGLATFVVVRLRRAEQAPRPVPVPPGAPGGGPS